MGPLAFIRQLPTGGVDILTTAAADCHHDAIIAQVAGEIVDAVSGSFAEGRTIDGVVLDNIDANRKTLAEFEQVASVIEAIIEILEGNILVADSVAGLEVEILQGIH